MVGEGIKPSDEPEFQDERFPNLRFMVAGNGQIVYEIVGENKVLKVLKNSYNMLTLIEKREHIVSFADFFTQLFQAIEATGKIRFPAEWQILGDLRYRNKQVGGFIQTKYDGLEEGVRTLDMLPLMRGVTGTDDTRVFFHVRGEPFEAEPIFLDWDTFVTKITLQIGENGKYPDTKEEFDAVLADMLTKIQAWGENNRRAR